MNDAEEGKAARPGEVDTPREAHDKTAPVIRKLRHGDDAPQRDHR